MEKGKAKGGTQRFFLAKELRLSIALIVIWSLLAGIFFTYITKLLGAGAEHGLLSFAAVFVGYLAVVILLAHFFAYRLIGPFERLKMEMRLVLAGNYERRLSVRTSDDLYIRSFIADVNKLLDRLENTCLDRNRLMREINTDLLKMLSLFEKADVPKEKIKEMLLAFREKTDALLESKK